MHGPNCLAIRSRFKRIGGLKGAGIDIDMQLGEEELAALQDQLQAQLQQYGGKQLDTKSMQSMLSDLWKKLGQAEAS
jgi:hypothetical protein